MIWHFNSDAIFGSVNWHELFNSLVLTDLSTALDWLASGFWAAGCVPRVSTYHRVLAYDGFVQALGLHMARLLARIISLVT